MPKAKKGGGGGHKAKVYSLPSAQKRRDLGVPKMQPLINKQQQKQKISAPTTPSVPALAALATSQANLAAYDPSILASAYENGIDASLTTRDSSAKAFMRELRKVIERSDVIIQVLDARDPEGTRSRWVEEEVRKRDVQGKKLLAVVNKIDLVPRANLEAWLKHLRHSFPTMPFKSSTQSQRQNLSQNAVPLVQSASVPGQQKAVLPELPSTSSSLGAPALLHLLKQYALSTPHSSLTVGVVGFPNVGKSSLINSLKRSRACAVAAMPGKTRVTQEVVLDKGVKIVDCPGVVLEDLGRAMEGEEGRRKQAELMLRNCVKAELVEDPISPVEVILSKVDPIRLQKLYNIPAYDDVRDFLIKVALTRGRLGKGGIPDLEGSAVSVLRDWNSGKISYYTTPPAIHPSSAPIASNKGAPIIDQDVEMAGGAPADKVGDAKILNTLSEAFTLDGLFDHLGDEAAWDGEEQTTSIAQETEILEPIENVSAPPAVDPFQAAMMSEEELEADSDSDGESDTFRPRPMPLTTVTSAQPSYSSTSTNTYSRAQAIASSSKLFTPEELATLPAGMLDRQKMKQQAKKAKKRQQAAERTAGELTLGFLGMDVEEPEVDGGFGHGQGQGGPSKKEKRKEKEKEKRRKAKESASSAKGMELDDDVMQETKKEQDFANFLANMGAEDSDDEL